MLGIFPFAISLIKLVFLLARVAIALTIDLVKLVWRLCCAIGRMIRGMYRFTVRNNRAARASKLQNSR